MLLLRRILICTLVCTFSFAQGQNADINILRDIHNPVNHGLTNVSHTVSKSVVPMAIAVPSAIFLVNYLETHSLTERNEQYVIAVALGTSAAITFGLKYAVNRPRPFVTYSDIEQRDMHVGPYSFPSGHTSTAFSLATSVSLCYPKWYVIAPGYIWASAVGYSRMRLGVHYPSDVLAGALIGSASAVASYYLTRWIWKKYFIARPPEVTQ